MLYRSRFFPPFWSAALSMLLGMLMVTRGLWQLGHCTQTWHYSMRREEGLSSCAFIFITRETFFRTSPAYFLSHLSGLNFIMPRKPSGFQRDETTLTHLLREAPEEGRHVYKGWLCLQRWGEGCWVGEQYRVLQSLLTKPPLLTQRYEYRIVTEQSSSDSIGVHRVAEDKDVKILLPAVYQKFSFAFLPLHPWKTHILRVNWKDGDSSLMGKGEQGNFRGMWVYTGYEFPTDIIINYHRLYLRQSTTVLYKSGGQKSEISISGLKLKSQQGFT